jgi:molybdenum cofactor cytidylyltransferase
MGDFKPLREFDGEPMVRRTVRRVLEGGVDEVCVVVGKNQAAVRSALDGLVVFYDASARAGRIIFAENPSFATTDMLHSIQQGLCTLLSEEAPSVPLTPAVAAVFVLPADMPAVAPATFALLRQTGERAFPLAAPTVAPTAAPVAPKATVFYPVFRGRRGHPLLFCRECFEAVLAFAGDGGLREALRRFGAQAVETDDEGILLDADTPAAFRRLLAHEAARRSAAAQDDVQ